jgi:hypothetical protein
MARTRGASAFHQDDGELLDNEGKPIPTGREAFAAAMLAPVTVAQPEAVQPETVISYVTDRAAWHRSMDGFEAIRLLDLLLGGLSLEMSADEVANLPADVRRHFRRVVKPVTPAEE